MADPERYKLGDKMELTKYKDGEFFLNLSIRRYELAEDPDDIGLASNPVSIEWEEISIHFHNDTELSTFGACLQELAESAPNL